MSSLELIQGSCADQNVDAVVNAANRNLSAGGGICGVIFKKAGYNELAESCKKYTTPLKDGDAVITPAFNMTNCKYIIHAVGPNFSYTPNAFKQLYVAYYNSFKVLVENGLTSISLPLISSGIFGGSLDNPVKESCKQCIQAYNNFIQDYKDKNISVKLCAFLDSEYMECRKLF
jgi:histone macroH2A1 family phosphatase